MALILRKAQTSRSSGTWGPHDYDVFAGGFPVGRIYRADNVSESQAQWLWAINGLFGTPPRCAFNGAAHSLEEAKAALAASWRKWLAWAELREAEPADVPAERD